MAEPDASFPAGVAALPGRTVQRLTPYAAREGRSEHEDALRLAPPVRARGVGEILDVALEVFVRRFWLCAGGSAFLWLLANGFGSRDTASQRLMPEGIEATFLVHYLTTAFVIVAVYGELQGKRVPAGQAVLLALKRFPALFVLALWPVLLFALMIVLIQSCAAIAFPFFVLGAVLLFWLLALAPAAIVLEDIGPLRAARRSAQLARGALRVWLTLALLQAWLVAPFAALPAVLELPQGREALERFVALPPGVAQGFWLIVRSLFEGVSTAFGAVVMAVFYVDRRVRKEGFDLTMRLERIEDRLAGGTR